MHNFVSQLTMWRVVSGGGLMKEESRWWLLCMKKEKQLKEYENLIF